MNGHELKRFLVVDLNERQLDGDVVIIVEDEWTSLDRVRFNEATGEIELLDTASEEE